ncbi:MAG: type II toxin-antitoxin system RelB/DinJ family antitoxin [Oscillospiraceae bacterium]|nr:type II toxin-antitoxin system RelB/DinJ family antitoxin [Oscillospiraceae bacterium]
MQKKSNVFARVEPEIKEQAEHILNQLGIPMSNAIGLFLRQIIMQRGIPFDMKLPARMPVTIGAMNAEELNNELQKGYDDICAGRLHDLDDVIAEMQKIKNNQTDADIN